MLYWYGNAFEMAREGFDNRLSFLRIYITTSGRFAKINDMLSAFERHVRPRDENDRGIRYRDKTTLYCDKETVVLVFLPTTMSRNMRSPAQIKELGYSTNCDFRECVENPFIRNNALGTAFMVEKARSTLPAPSMAGRDRMKSSTIWPPYSTIHLTRKTT